MARIRVVLLALAVLLMLPMVFLVKRTLDGIDSEREVQHRAVADRVFDEMERELSAFLAEEKRRPFGHYRFYYVPEGLSGTGVALLRSPLSKPPAHPWVLGYFQIDPDEKIYSPMLPRSPAVARQNGDWAESPELFERVREIERIVKSSPLASRPVPQAPQAPTTASTAPIPRKREHEPGTTRHQRIARLESKESPDQLEDASESIDAAPESAPEDSEGSAAYDAIRSLNRGISQRPESQPTKVLSLHLSQAEGGSGVTVTASVHDVDTGEMHQVGEATLALEGATKGRFWDPSAVLRGDRPEPGSVEVLPLMARLIDSEHILLYRPVISSLGRYRQGMVLDIFGLASWLDETVLAGNPLQQSARRQFFAFAHGPPPPRSPEDFVYVHRFAVPFDDVGVQLSLAPLPGGASRVAYVYAIALMLVLAGCAGFFAVYRMVAVTVAFAERRSNFAAAVSHELKTPLTAIRMYSEMLRDGMAQSEEKRWEYASTITNECERLTRLINNVLEFSRLEQGTRDLSLVSGAIGPVVEEAARILEPHAKQAGFRLELAVEAGLPPVRFDRDAVLQVVFNLVDNGLKYARGAQEPVVTLRCATRDGGVVLSVRDHGPGVPSRHLPRVFEAFYRGGDELTRTAKGSGIGLALVKGLAERMGAVVAGRNLDDGGFEVSLRFQTARVD